MKVSRRLLLSVCLSLATTVASADSGARDGFSGKPVLIISGKIANKNDGGDYVFDMAMLERLPQHSFLTRSPWFKEAREHTGPLLRDVLAAAGAHGTMLTAYALNDYKVTMPVSDATTHAVIVARLLDGRPMPVRNKGPLFIIYPFDDNSELRAQTYYGRSVWQLREIHVHD